MVQTNMHVLSSSDTIQQGLRISYMMSHLGLNENYAQYYSTELSNHLTVGDDKDHLEHQLDILQPRSVEFCVNSTGF